MAECRKCGAELKENQNVTASSECFTDLQKSNFEKVSKEFYTSTNWERLLSLITPVYEKHPENEEVLYYYLQILIKSDLEAAKEAVSSLNDELFEVCCAKFDIAIKQDNLPEAENILEEAEAKWNDNKILKYKRALFLLTLGAKEENDDCIADALELLASMKNPADKREEREAEKSFNTIDKLYDLEFVPEMIEKIAEQGNAVAQNNLGRMYEWGKGVEQDYEEAVKWYRKSAEQGDAFGQFALGKMCGVEQDYEEAVEWYRKSAEQEYARGQVVLGEMYEEGKGVEQDYEEAVKWYRKSAEQGDAFGQFALGEMYYRGKGVEQDYGEAVKWYRKLAEQGDFRGKRSLKRLAYQGNSNAEEAIERLAEQGDSQSQCCSGEMYEEGYGVEQDYEEAVKWYRKAAEQGDGFGQYNLGRMYEEGKGVEQDDEEAVKWYKKSAEQGNASGQCNLGRRYEYGQGVEQDYEEAVKWYTKSAEQEYAPAKKVLERLENS